MDDKIVITKENLINIISEKCKDDYISVTDLIKIIEKSIDEDGSISKKKIIKLIRSYHTKMVIKDVYCILEDFIFESLSNVNRKQNVCIKLFEGISLDGIFVSEKMKKNNLTGKTNLVESKIKPKFTITRTYCEKLNNK